MDPAIDPSHNKIHDSNFSPNPMAIRAVINTNKLKFNCGKLIRDFSITIVLDINIDNI